MAQSERLLVRLRESEMRVRALTKSPREWQHLVERGRHEGGGGSATEVNEGGAFVCLSTVRHPQVSLEVSHRVASTPADVAMRQSVRGT